MTLIEEMQNFIALLKNVKSEPKQATRLTTRPYSAELQGDDALDVDECILVSYSKDKQDMIVITDVVDAENKVYACTVATSGIAGIPAFLDIQMADHVVDGKRIIEEVENV